jgi:hypothetical protein
LLYEQLWITFKNPLNRVGIAKVSELMQLTTVLRHLQQDLQYLALEFIINVAALVHPMIMVCVPTI